MEEKVGNKKDKTGFAKKHHSYTQGFPVVCLQDSSWSESTSIHSDYGKEILCSAS